METLLISEHFLCVTTAVAALAGGIPDVEFSEYRPPNGDDHKTVRVSAEKKTGRPMRHSRVRKPSFRIVPLSTICVLHERADHAEALMIEIRLYQFAPYVRYAHTQSRRSSSGKRATSVKILRERRWRLPG